MAEFDRKPGLDPVERSFGWGKLVLLLLVMAPLLYFGAIALLWYSASREVKVESAATVPAAVAKASARNVASDSAPAADSRPAAAEAQRPADRTDYGPTNYNPWTDEAPKGD